ncbi:riboflavin synthase [Caldalkalibacillus salinus]|uniref:riboflavin synthase n=1 Tax=Caldalkalibacillus salinus TaxID=2803787 RepID=UPI0019222AB1|nr:riboflavin synthase [Caldalkalibacillus salinus]
MFTGIIEEVGYIQSMTKTSKDYKVSIAASKVVEDVQNGDSISVNGACLTVVSYTPQGFVVDVMPETLKATSLAQLQQGSQVNLERAMAANARFGGHIVSGHVDTVGKIQDRRTTANATYFHIELDQDWLKYFVPKGSVTVDGISLTVMEVQDPMITISIIPHTLSETNLHAKQVGDMVNIECDVLAKYMERLINKRLEGHDMTKGGQAGLTQDILSENGFM